LPFKAITVADIILFIILFSYYGTLKLVLHQVFPANSRNYSRVTSSNVYNKPSPHLMVPHGYMERFIQHTFSSVVDVNII